MYYHILIPFFVCLRYDGVPEWVQHRMLLTFGAPASIAQIGIPPQLLRALWMQRKQCSHWATLPAHTDFLILSSCYFKKITLGLCKWKLHLHVVKKKINTLWNVMRWEGKLHPGCRLWSWVSFSRAEKPWPVVSHRHQLLGTEIYFFTEWISHECNKQDIPDLWFMKKEQFVLLRKHEGKSHADVHGLFCSGKQVRICVVNRKHPWRPLLLWGSYTS